MSTLMLSLEIRDEQILKRWPKRIFEYIQNTETCSNKYLNIQ